MNHIEITPEELRKLQQQAVVMGLGHEVAQKLEWFLFYLESGNSVAQTCKHFGIARSTFYRWVQRFNAQDLRTLQERSHRPRILRQPKVTQTLISLVRIYRMQDPYIGKDQVAELLEAEHNIAISPSTVGRIIAQEGFYFGDSMLHHKKRSESLEGTTQEEPETTEREEDAPQNTENEFQIFAQAGKSLVRCIWQKFRRPIIVVSLLTNIAFIALLLMTAAWESSVAERRGTEEAALELHNDGRAAAPDIPHIETNTIVHE